MKKKLIYTCTLFSCLLFLMGCADDLVSGIFRGDGVQLTINLNVPGESSAATRAIKTRVGGENQYDNGLDPNTEYQRYIAEGDLYILVFENTSSSSEENWQLLAVPTITNIEGQQGDETRILTAMMSRVSGSKELLVDVVANLAENGVTDVDFSNMIGSSRETIYEAIGTFAYPANDQDNPYGVWSLETTDASGSVTAHRYLPMWGQSSTATTGGRMTYEVDGNTTEMEVHCGLYRSVAKMGLLVDSECTTFQPTELYVYYINNEGTFVSLPVQDTNWSPSINVQYTLPEVPEDATARTIEYPLVYKWDTALGSGESYLNQIYVTEADNKNNSTNPVCLVVGGYYLGGEYNGEGLVDGSSTTDQYTLNYYRIDLESLTTDAEGTTTSGAFDVIRNHSYLFNIKNANNPGTSDPDPRSAAAGLEVEILDYTEVPMHGINTQYTLTVNKSLFAFEGATTSVGALAVSTDGGVEWQLVTDWSELEGYPTEGGTTIPEWATVYDPETHTNSNDTVYIAVDANVNNESLRNGSFWIQAGDVIKRIDLVQDYTETANSYIVTEEGTYEMKINIRGNANTQAWTTSAEDEAAKESIDFGMGADIADVAYVDIIWETADGFVTIPEPYDISQSGSIEYKVTNVSLDEFGDWTGKVFDPGNGANALIGVFNSNNELLWSYHIWGVGDFKDEVPMETWVVGNATTTNRYSFMDRNLGAYTNLPGSKSFGLLYQWGRKDPFIGAYRELTVNGNDSTYERDYRQVRKQYTKHYKTLNNKTYLWSEQDDEGSATTEDAEKTLVQYTIEHPTTILEDGLLSEDHDNAQAEGLWGTTDKSYVNSEAGNKTMYDPCPPGYRMPSLNALTIWDGTNDMWAGGGVHSYLSTRYVPVPHGSSYLTTSTYEADFVSDAPFYGFWLDYANEYGFNKMTLDAEGNIADTAEGYGVNYYDWEHPASDKCGWVEGHEGVSPEGLTWIPLAGVYNGTINNFGRAGLTDVPRGARDQSGGPDGQGGDQGGQGGQGGTQRPVRRKAAQTPRGDGAGYLPASSLHVTSVLWANSPNETNGAYPAGLLLHGTEGAYAPHYTVNNRDTTYWYSPGVVTNGVGNAATATDPIATEGAGYWITSTDGYGTAACGWWTGSVDADEGETMDASIASGQWNTNTGYEGIANYSNWSDENGMAGSGRHFHSYTETDPSTYANPSYAASVRCIKDKDALTPNDDKLYYYDEETSTWTAYDSNVTLYLYEYGEGTVGSQNTKDVITLYLTFAEEWEVTYPGAKWVSISPTSGTTTNPQGATQAIEITYTDNTDYVPTQDEEATIIITTARDITFTITVKYVGGTRGQN